MIDESSVFKPLKFYCIRIMAKGLSVLTTVDSRYLEIEETLKNSSRYPYFDISDL